jgi:hypothetical protein
MFNTTIVAPTRKEYVPYEKEVHVHRAPTDESVSLLNEMQEKTVNNIVKQINVTDNTLNAVVTYFYDDICMFEYKYIIKFTFNGKEFDLRGSINRHELMTGLTYGSQKVVLHLAKSIALLFAEYVIKMSVPDLEKMLERH